MRKQKDPSAALAAQPRVKGANPAAQSVEYRRCPSCGVQICGGTFASRRA
jgi:hypothetical protein